MVRQAEVTELANHIIWMHVQKYPLEFNLRKRGYTPADNDDDVLEVLCLMDNYEKNILMQALKVTTDEELMAHLMTRRPVQALLGNYPGAELMVRESGSIAFERKYGNGSRSRREWKANIRDEWRHT